MNSKIKAIIAILTTIAMVVSFILFFLNIKNNLVGVFAIPLSLLFYAFGLIGLFDFERYVYLANMFRTKEFDIDDYSDFYLGMGKFSVALCLLFAGFGPFAMFLFVK